MAEPKEEIETEADKNRDGKGRFIEGNCANPMGRPRESGANELRRVIEEVQKSKDKTLLEHYVERAYTSDTVLVAITKKLYPDLRATEALIRQEGASRGILVNTNTPEDIDNAIERLEEIKRDRKVIDKDYNKAEDAICVG